MAPKNENESKLDLSTVPGIASPIQVADVVKDEDIILTIENLHKKIFILWYRNRFRPAQANLVANDIKDAQQRGERYCKRYGLKFISVVHFFLDPESAPRELSARYETD